MGKAELKIEIDPDMVAEAERLSVEQVLARRRNALKTDAERAAEARVWAEENAEALRAYNERIVRDGIFGENFRTW